MPATVNVVFFRPKVYKGYSTIGPVRTSENLTSSGTSSQGTVTSLDNEVCLITALGGNVYVNSGTNPVAEAGDILVLDGVPTYVYLTSGHKMAVIDA